MSDIDIVLLKMHEISCYCSENQCKNVQVSADKIVGMTIPTQKKTRATTNPGFSKSGARYDQAPRMIFNPSSIILGASFK